MSTEEKRRKNIEFVLVVLSIFLSAALIYGALGYMSDESDTIIAGLFGGYFISSLYCGAYILVQWVKNKNIAVKMLCGFFFPFVMVLVEACGIVCLIPMIIIKIVQIITYKNKSKEVDIQNEVKENDA